MDVAERGWREMKAIKGREKYCNVFAAATRRQRRSPGAQDEDEQLTLISIPLPYVSTPRQYPLCVEGTNEFRVGKDTASDSERIPTTCAAGLTYLLNSASL